MADESDFDLAFKAIMAADAKENASPDAKPAAVASVSAADIAPPAVPVSAPQPQERQADTSQEKTEFEMPPGSEQPPGGPAEPVGGPSAGQVQEAGAVKEASPEPPQPQQSPNQEFMKQFADTLKATLQPPVSPQPQPQPQQQPQLMSDEEAQFLTQYDQDYPDIARAEFIRRRIEYNQLLQYAFGEIARSIAPIAQTVQTIAERMHLGDIQGQVPDYNSIRNQVVEWVDKQPPYLRYAYTHVVQGGTQEEVVDLINRWRADTGKALPNGAANGHQPPRKLRAPTPEAQAAAAALAPVVTKRTGAVAAEPTTFDDAFAEFAKQMS